jgi:ppGpp synthetase/RelA/SpoT-type nucleotidyltranferase
MRELLNIARAEHHLDFEMREVEHSLCEFDKYERTRLGQGRPRSKYVHKEKQ